MVKSHKDISNHYYGFVNLPNQWISDNDRSYPDRFFDDKNYEDFYFDNFYDMDEMFGHENSLFGTKGLPVGHPDRSSKSFDVYTKKHGPMIVRVIKKNDLQEQIRRILKEETKMNIRLRRRLGMLDYEIEFRLRAVYTPDNICRYESGEELLDVVGEAAIESMYYKYFGNMDDNSKEWERTYYDMVHYIDMKYGERIKDYYNNNCENKV
jgi:hypothetical protein